MSKNYTEMQEWCDGVSQIAVDALLDANLIDRDQFEKAADIVAEEIFARLTVGDYPPPLIA
jgi:hypothetical protein